MNIAMHENCPHCERLQKASRGELKTLVKETENVIVIAGDHQYFPGYCVVISKIHVREMHSLSEAAAAAIFRDVLNVGKQIESAYKSHKMNYVSLGNVDEHLHWHVMPRYLNDPDHRDHPWKNVQFFGEKPTTTGAIQKLKELFSRS